MRDRFLIDLFVLVLIILTSILFVCSYNYKIKYYYSFNMIYIDNNRYTLLVNNKELKLIKSNRTIYIDDKKYEYEIIKYNKNIINNYCELVIKINKDTEYKFNDVVIGNIIKKRIRLISIFKSIIN